MLSALFPQNLLQCGGKTECWVELLTACSGLRLSLPCLIPTHKVPVLESLDHFYLDLFIYLFIFLDAKLGIDFNEKQLEGFLWFGATWSAHQQTQDQK